MGSSINDDEFDDVKVERLASDTGAKRPVTGHAYRIRQANMKV